LTSRVAQQLMRDRVESMIALAAPFLDLVLGVGDRISRVVGSEDHYYPIRSPAEVFALGPAEPERETGEID
jgi:hypothetical protein